MSDETNDLPSTTSDKLPETKRQRRTSRKRVSFKKTPRPAPGVRDLWNQASEEERKRAHELCMSILEYWMGRVSKGDLAARLNIPGLRVWQLSQQALSGMLAGLLRQPRRRVKVVADPAHPELDPRLLRQRIAKLEKMLSRTEDLVRVLKHMPWGKEEKHGTPEAKPAASRPKKKQRTRPTSPREMAPGTTQGRTHEAR